MFNMTLLRDAVKARVGLIPSGLPLPADIVYDNDEYAPDPGRSYLIVLSKELRYEQRSMAPGTPTKPGHGTQFGRTIFTFYGASDVGPAPFEACMQPLKAYFAAGTLFASGGQSVTISGNPGPAAGDILPTGQGGFSYQLLTVPWYVLVRSAVIP